MTLGEIGVSYRRVAAVLGWTPCTSTESKGEPPHSVWKKNENQHEQAIDKYWNKKFLKSQIFWR